MCVYNTLLAVDIRVHVHVYDITVQCCSLVTKTNNTIT